MPEEFDPYRKWLGIALHEQPAHHYRLLGIAPFEDDPDVIENAADRQMAHVRTFQSGKHRDFSQKILNELSAAKGTLLDPARKAVYDARLHDTIYAQADQPAMAEDLAPLPAPPPPLPLPPIAASPRRESLAPPPVEAAYADYEEAYEANPPSIEAATPVPIAVPVPAEPSLGTGVAVSKSRPRAATNVRPGPRPKVRKPKSSPVMLVAGLVGVGAVMVIMLVILVTQTGGDKRGKKAVRHDAKPETPKKQPPDKTPTPSQPPTNGKETPPKTNPPKTTDPPKPEVPRAEKFQTAVRDANSALHGRDLQKAKIAIDNAEFSKSTPADDAEVARLRTLYGYLDDFWRAVRAGVYDGMQEGEKFAYRGDEVQLIKREGEEVTLKSDGRERQHKISELPANLAALFARKGMQETEARTYLCLCAFWTLDDRATKSPRSQQTAKAMWVDAAERGVKDDVLAKELRLDEKFISSIKQMEVSVDPIPDLPKPNFDPPPLDKPSLGKTSAPADEVLRDAKQRFTKRYGEELAKVRNKPPEYEAFVLKLEEEAGAEKDEALAYVIFGEAADASAALLRHDLVIKFVDALAQKWDVDALRLKQQLLAKARPVNSPALENFADAALALAKDAEAAQRLDVAIAAGNHALRVGDKIKGRDQKDLQRRVREWEAQVDAAERAKAAETALAANPADAAAHLYAGRYLAYFKRDWKAGLTHLSESNNEEEKALALADLASPTDAAAQAALGERWYAVAKKKVGVPRFAALERAKYWLETALPNLDAGGKTSAESRLRDIAKETAPMLP